MARLRQAGRGVVRLVERVGGGVARLHHLRRLQRSRSRRRQPAPHAGRSGPQEGAGTMLRHVRPREQDRTRRVTCEVPGETSQQYAGDQSTARRGDKQVDIGTVSPLTHYRGWVPVEENSLASWVRRNDLVEPPLGVLPDELGIRCGDTGVGAEQNPPGGDVETRDADGQRSRPSLRQPRFGQTTRRAALPA